jgi:hypothetical protein
MGLRRGCREEAWQTVDRKNWRVLLNWHVAETREKAREQAKHGLMRWHNEYIVGTLQRPGAGHSTPRTMLWTRRPSPMARPPRSARRTIS